MNKEQFLETGLLEQYILGLTDEEETELVEKYLNQYPELKEKVQDAQQSLEQYARQYALRPPEELRERVVREVRHFEPATQSFSFDWRKWVSYAALIALTAGLFFSNRALQRNQNQLQKANLQLTECQREKNDLTESAAIAAFFSDQGTQTIYLGGSAPSGGEHAIAYWNIDDQKAFVNIADLPEPPEGKQYQIWVDVDGEMINAGLLALNESIQPITFHPDAESLNITVEPLGGSNHPTVEKLLVNGYL